MLYCIAEWTSSRPNTNGNEPEALGPHDPTAVEKYRVVGRGGGKDDVMRCPKKKSFKADVSSGKRGGRPRGGLHVPPLPIPSH
jgi:hypothetical protein